MQTLAVIHVAVSKGMYQGAHSFSRNMFSNLLEVKNIEETSLTNVLVWLSIFIFQDCVFDHKKQ